MASIRIPIVTAFYQEYLNDQDSAAFIKKVCRHYLPATLERLVEHPVATVRRAAVLALGFVGSYESNATLGRAMTDKDARVRRLAQSGIRRLWCRDGDDRLRQRLAAIVHLNTSRQYAEAVKSATSLIEYAPWLAEAWNQRAQGYYGMGRMADSIRDCRQALEINPYHFEAATGMGQCSLHLGDSRAALECLRRALRLNPELEGVRAGIETLERTLRQT